MNHARRVGLAALAACALLSLLGFGVAFAVDRMLDDGGECE